MKVINIILINKEIFQKRPPVISTLLLLSDLGYKVTLVTVDINDYWKNVLESRNIEIYVIPNKNNRDLLSKTIEYLNFREKVLGYIQDKGYHTNETLLWIIGGNTIYSLGERIKRYHYILQIQELHENDKRFKQAFSKVINDAEAVFVNEYNRAVLFQCWYKMPTRPFVIPNKPYSLIEEQISINVLNKFEDVLKPLKDKKIILYQGGISYIRKLDRIALAINKMNANYHLLMVGPEHDSGLMNELKAITPEITHIGFMPSPDYLAFCKIAHIGYVSYEPNSLNNIYCAPNKIFEYSAFGLPMIANDIPGLRYTIGVSGACELVEPSEVDSIIDGIIKIEKNYLKYKENSFNFYIGVDNKKTISEVLMSLQMYDR